ncbi:MAG: PilZ domain-containing protein [Acidobacteriia bacterium]|nr:PilZ domain-containing protein [Terriglobia bacterium]
MSVALRAHSISKPKARPSAVDQDNEERLLICTHRDCCVPIQLRLPDAQDREIPAALSSVTGGVFQVRAPVQIKVGTALELVHPDAKLQAVVIDCDRLAGGTYLLGIVLADDLDRRSQARMAADWPATLRIAGSISSIPVTIVDASPAGLGLEVAAPLAIGALVTIDWQAASAHGKICHCAPHRTDYRVGVRVREMVLRESAVAMQIGAGQKPLPASWARSVHQRQAAYEAILYSLAAPITA